MNAKEAKELQKGDRLVQVASERTAFVIQPAMPKYVLIQFADSGEHNVPAIDHMEGFNRVTA